MFLSFYNEYVSIMMFLSKFERPSIFLSYLEWQTRNIFHNSQQTVPHHERVGDKKLHVYILFIKGSNFPFDISHYETTHEGTGILGKYVWGNSKTVYLQGDLTLRNI